jgi:hypothetical protein
MAAAIDVGLTRRYRVYGLELAIRTNSAAVSDAIHARLRLFAEGRGDSELILDFVENPGGTLVRRPEGPSRPLWEIPGYEFAYFPTTDQLYIRRSDVVALVCDPGAGLARCSVGNGAVDQVWFVSHALFTVPLIEMLKRRGRFAIHAAAIELDGRGVLFAGATGSGKSTLALALLRAGMGFLGDDTVFVSYGAQGLRIRAFPDEIDITDNTARLFPELIGFAGKHREPGWPKHRLWPEKVYDLRLTWECAPCLLVFPTLTNSAESQVELIGGGEALVELLPNIPLTDARSSQAHLDALGDLVRHSRCYRLRLGRDLDRLPSVIGALVSE